MSISQKLGKCYKNQIENIKNEKNYEFKIKQIGALVLDVGGRCISTISTAIGCCRAFVKKCYIKVRDKLEIKSNKNRCGRKKITEKYPELTNDINVLIILSGGCIILFSKLTIPFICFKTISISSISSSSKNTSKVCFRRG